MIHVIDANVFIHGRRPDFPKMVAPPEVLEEIKSRQGERSFDASEVTVREPSNRSKKKVREKAEDINSPTSEPDEVLVALALDLGGKVVSDDRAVQNLADHLGIKYEGFMEDEIDERISWKIICPSCGREEADRCSSCGKKSIRKPV